MLLFEGEPTGSAGCMGLDILLCGEIRVGCAESCGSAGERLTFQNYRCARRKGNGERRVGGESTLGAAGVGVGWWGERSQGRGGGESRGNLRHECVPCPGLDAILLLLSVLREWKMAGGYCDCLVHSPTS